MSFEKNDDSPVYSMSSNGSLYYNPPQRKHKSIYVCDKCYNALYLRKSQLDNSNFSNF